MDQHLGHAERVGHEAGVLAAGAAEAVQRIAGDVIAALHRDFLDGVRHVLDGDLDEAVGDLFRRFAADLLRQFGERGFHRAGVERLVLVRAEDLREEIGDQLADQHIGVGDGERPAAAVAFRAGIGAGGIRADAKARPIEVQHRAAAGRDRVNEHHRRAHAHARHLGLEGALVFAVVVRHVGRGAAHVEADQMGEARLASGLGHADHAAGRAGQDGVLALEQLGGGEAARRHHEHQADAAVGAGIQILGDHGDIAAEDGGEVGVDHGGVAAADQLDQRRHLVADRDLREAHAAGELRHALLVIGIAVGVHEHDGDGLDAVGHRLFERGAHGVEIKLALDGAVGQHALVDLDDALEQHLRLDDVLGENLRPRLVADAKRVAKALGGQQQRALALALQQRVGGDRGAHLHRADAARRDWLAFCKPEQVADALDGGVAIGLRVLRQELVGRQRAVRAAADDIGEGAAAVDPEVPLVLGFWLFHASLKCCQICHSGARRRREPGIQRQVQVSGFRVRPWRAVPQ